MGISRILKAKFGGKVTKEVTEKVLQDDNVKEALSILKEPEVESSRALAKLSLIIQGQIKLYGIPNVRKQVIQSIEGDCKRVAKQLHKKQGNFTLDDMMNTKLFQQALKTPEYMDMLKALGMDESHLRVMALQALKERLKV